MLMLRRFHILNESAWNDLSFKTPLPLCARVCVGVCGVLSTLPVRLIYACLQFSSGKLFALFLLQLPPGIGKAEGK